MYVDSFMSPWHLKHMGRCILSLPCDLTIGRVEREDGEENEVKYTWILCRMRTFKTKLENFTNKNATHSCSFHRAEFFCRCLFCCLIWLGQFDLICDQTHNLWVPGRTLYHNTSLWFLMNTTIRSFIYYYSNRGYYSLLLKWFQGFVETYSSLKTPKIIK